MRTSTAHFKVSGVAAPTISRTLAQLNHLITLCAPTLSCIDRLFVDYVAFIFALRFWLFGAVHNSDDNRLMVAPTCERLVAQFGRVRNASMKSGHCLECPIR
jgi:hypothetical protein